jgi:hypothetical protein
MKRRQEQAPRSRERRVQHTSPKKNEQQTFKDITSPYFADLFDSITHFDRKGLASYVNAVYTALCFMSKLCGDGI